MEETLELKHISPYLPYGLQLLNAYSNTVKLSIHHVFNDYGNFIGIHNEAKLILRPISDLTKVIEIEGKKFVPIEWLLEYNRHTKDTKPCAVLLDGTIEMQYYKDYQKLFEWHFDVFGLIEKGLAVDINTLNK